MKSSRLPSKAMRVNQKDYRCGVDPVMSQAGAVPGPNASMKMGPPLATSGHNSCPRYVKVKQRKRNKGHKTRTKPDPPKKNRTATELPQYTAAEFRHWNIKEKDRISPPTL